jgi:hypothetical protein
MCSTEGTLLTGYSPRTVAEIPTPVPLYKKTKRIWISFCMNADRSGKRPAKKSTGATDGLLEHKIGLKSSKRFRF